MSKERVEVEARVAACGDIMYGHLSEHQPLVELEYAPETTQHPQRVQIIVDKRALHVFRCGQPVRLIIEAV
jgi:hypothetical protein